MPNGIRLRPGERYRLRVETSLGLVTGATTVPLIVGGFDGGNQTFNVDRDTLRLTATPERGVAGYLLKHEGQTTGFSERYVTTIDAPLLLPAPPQDPERQDGEPAWAFSFTRSNIRPGLTQTFVVVALDSNYFKYYVAGFDPFGDDTKGNTLTGGVGLFGAVAPVVVKSLQLVANIDTPVEGTWVAERVTAVLPRTLSLYSSPSFPATGLGAGVSVAGRADMASRTYEVQGALRGSNLTLGLNLGQGDFLALTGLLGTDTLVLTDSRTQERVTYRKR